MSAHVAHIDCSVTGFLHMWPVHPLHAQWGRCLSTECVPVTLAQDMSVITLEPKMDTFDLHGMHVISHSY